MYCGARNWKLESKKLEAFNVPLYLWTTAGLLRSWHVIVDGWFHWTACRGIRRGRFILLIVRDVFARSLVVSWYLFLPPLACCVGCCFQSRICVAAQDTRCCV